MKTHSITTAPLQIARFGAGIMRTAVRGTSASRHEGGPIKGLPPKTPGHHVNMVPRGSMRGLHAERRVPLQWIITKIQVFVYKGKFRCYIIYIRIYIYERRLTYF